MTFVLDNIYGLAGGALVLLGVFNDSPNSVISGTLLILLNNDNRIERKIDG